MVQSKFFLQWTFSHDNAFYSFSHNCPTPASRNKQQITRQEQIPELNIGCCSVLGKESSERQNELSFHNYYKCGCSCTYYTRQVNHITRSPHGPSISVTSPVVTTIDPPVISYSLYGNFKIRNLMFPTRRLKREKKFTHCMIHDFIYITEIIFSHLDYKSKLTRYDLITFHK